MIFRTLVPALSLLAGGLAIPASAQVPLQTALDKAFAKAAAGVGDPGAQAVAVKDGKVIWSAKSGRAINEPSAPVTGSTLFSLGSFGKTILAAYALRLTEKKVLALDTPISVYVGKKVAGSQVVTLRMLLTHTSGYPDMYADPKTAPLFEGGKKYDPNRPYTFAMLAPGIRKPVNPGKRYEYSNTGFIVLAHVLSKVSGGGEALERDLRRFLRGAGTSAGHLTAERSGRAFSRFAHGYTVGDGGALTDFSTAHGAKAIPTDLYGLPFGDGMFAGTATGGARFLDALFVDKRLLRAATVKTMTTPSPQSRAADGTYGMATERTKVGKRTWQGHGGAYGGFTSMGATDRARGVTLMVVTNRMGAADVAGTIWTKLAQAYASATP
ncbi:serine hydrolase domain-containing protein [Nonomuraea endophytica]|uniref:CubicO group peptidase (Beta-lactamase class C family) n=1 Tax=Nonomuraea endophytica TaxID=714136 RepID=A0A7W8A3V0_9ACTN|nr:serine hydrolase domain-containing protein [Nonomuraea endophytica]MBB5079087.1 CubicO group peptidase (beta-lactamase class C family) [Nonomuraea endophytica]